MLYKSNKHFADFKANLFPFFAVYRFSLNRKSSNDQLEMSGGFPSSSLTSPLLRNLESSIGLLRIRGSDHVWKWSFLTEKQGQQRSGPVLTSLSTPSPWSLLERNELSTVHTSFMRRHIYRRLTCPYECMWVVQTRWSSLCFISNLFVSLRASHPDTDQEFVACSPAKPQTLCQQSSVCQPTSKSLLLALPTPIFMRQKSFKNGKGTPTLFKCVSTFVWLYLLFAYSHTPTLM